MEEKRHYVRKLEEKGSNGIKIINKEMIKNLTTKNNL